MFSGGSYEEVGRWLRNFLTSHAKRENPRAEVVLEMGEDRQGRSYGVRFRLGDRLSPAGEYAFPEVASQRGTLLWCRDLATRARASVRTLAGAAGVAAGRAE